MSYARNHCRSEYGDHEVPRAYVIDLVVADRLIIEVKAVAANLAPPHRTGADVRKDFGLPVRPPHQLQCAGAAIWNPPRLPPRRRKSLERTIADHSNDSMDSTAVEGNHTTGDQLEGLEVFGEFEERWAGLGRVPHECREGLEPILRSGPSSLLRVLRGPFAFTARINSKDSTYSKRSKETTTGEQVEGFEENAGRYSRVFHTNVAKIWSRS
jgi:hypothetical protein